MAKSKSSQRWLEKHRKDPYVKQAKEEGLRGRASFKLQEIQKKYRFIKPHTTILDLGSAPGSWSQYLSQTVKHSTLIACDLLPMPPIINVTFIQGDFTEATCQEAITAHAESVDLIICDMAPNATGQSKVDQWRAGALTETVFAFCLEHLAPGGKLLIKLFHGSEFDGHRMWLREHFDQVTLCKPPSSRKESRETYALAQNFNPQK